MDEGWGEANGEALNQIPGVVLELSAEPPALLSCFFIIISNSFHVPIHEPKGVVSPWVKVIYWQYIC